jgi:fructose-1,6-bisphosphatase/inositol monophosphatase family enzyme
VKTGCPLDAHRMIDLVTISDVAAERAIAAHIRRLMPDVGIAIM